MLGQGRQEKALLGGRACGPLGLGHSLAAVGSAAAALPQGGEGGATGSFSPKDSWRLLGRLDAPAANGFPQAMRGAGCWPAARQTGKGSLGCPLWRAKKEWRGGFGNARGFLSWSGDLI